MARFVKNAAIIAAGWLLAGVVAELAFRAGGDRPSLDLKGLYSPFRDNMYKLSSNIDTDANWTSGHLTVHTDSLGLRCDGTRRLAAHTGDTVDIEFLGDSQGFGNGLDFEASLAGATAIAAAQDGVRVVNASVGGHSAATQFEIAAWLHDEQHLKVKRYVLLVTPAIAQSGDYLTRARVGDDGRLYEYGVGRGAVVRLWFKTHVVTYARLRDATRNLGVGIEPTRESFVFGFYTNATEPRLQESFSAFVQRLKVFASRQGASLTLVYVPLALEADFEPVRAAASAAGIMIDRDVPLRACKAAAHNAAVPLINLRPVLERLHAEGNLLHLRADFHYNEEVSKACAGVLWAALSSVRLPPSSFSFTSP